MRNRSPGIRLFFVNDQLKAVEFNTELKRMGANGQELARIHPSPPQNKQVKQGAPVEFISCAYVFKLLILASAKERREFPNVHLHNRERYASGRLRVIGKDTTLASATYEQLLREVEQLTDEERARLKEVLNAPARPSGAAFVAFLETAEPIRPEALDAMEAAIREIDMNDADGR